MDRNNPLVRQKGESPQAYKAFEEYIQDRRVSIAYSAFMMHNPDALTTERTFIVWMEKYHWIERAKAFDIEREVEVARQARISSLDNNLTAEQVSSELFNLCMDEFRIRRSNMNDCDMVKFLKVATDINLKASKDAPAVTVNVEQSNQSTVNVSDEVLKELGKKLAGSEDDDPL